MANREAVQDGGAQALEQIQDDFLDNGLGDGDGVGHVEQVAAVVAVPTPDEVLEAARVVHHGPVEQQIVVRGVDVAGAAKDSPEMRLQLLRHPIERDVDFLDRADEAFANPALARSEVFDVVIGPALGIARIDPRPQHTVTRCHSVGSWIESNSDNSTRFGFGAASTASAGGGKRNSDSRSCWRNRSKARGRLWTA